MKVVAIANTKGGVGKTTLCLALAVACAGEGNAVAVVDLDPQKSMLALFGRRGESKSPFVWKGDGDTAADALADLADKNVDWVFIDGPPAFLSVVEEAIAAADLTVIPIKPSALDMLATQDAVTLARQAGAAFLVVINDVQPREKVTDSARAQLVKFKVPVAETEIAHRVSHVAGATVGKSAAEVNGGRDKAAAEEVATLWAEVKAAAAKAARAKSRREKAHG